MEPKEHTTTEQVPQPEPIRARYASPKLIEYGSLQTLTQTGEGTNPDGGLPFEASGGGGMPPRP